MMRIKIVHIIGGFNYGGVEKLVYDLVTEQAESIEVLPEILVLNDSGEFAMQFQQLGVPITAINPKSTYRFSLSHIRKVISLFKSTKIIHFHGFHLFIAIFASLSGKKIVFTEHGNFGFGRKVKLSDKLSHILRKNFYKYFVEDIACNSNFTKQYLNENWKLNNSRIKTIYNGSNITLGVNDNAVNHIKRQYNKIYL